MQRNNDSKTRKSGFNPNRTCYLTADGKYYCYERWDDDAKCVVTQRLEVGKDLSLELTIMLDESDHDMDLQDRYESELRDPLFDAKVNSYKADPDNEDAVDPWDMITDKKFASLLRLFPGFDSPAYEKTSQSGWFYLWTQWKKDF